MVHILSTILSLMVCPSLFTEFVNKYNKHYLSNIEYHIRERIFCDNYEFIYNHNLQDNHTYVLDVNEFTDLTHDEFINTLTAPIAQLMNDKNENEKIYDTNTYTNKLPETFDWRDNGHVSIVKNQGQCGSCWAFSTTGVIESHLSIYKNMTVLLSEQELVDCSWMYANLGCSGGLVDNAFKYVRRFGLATEDEYNYYARNRVCKIKYLSSHANTTHITGWFDVQANNETRLTETLYNVGPISVAIDASSKEFRFYKSGVFDKCGTSLDHAVLLTGFGVENGNEYYTIKNSWGDSYGDSGYIRIARGRHAQGGVGTCGITMSPSYPTVV